MRRMFAPLSGQLKDCLSAQSFKHKPQKQINRIRFPLARSCCVPSFKYQPPVPVHRYAINIHLFGISSESVCFTNAKIKQKITNCMQHAQLLIICDKPSTASALSSATRCQPYICVSTFPRLLHLYFFSSFLFFVGCR